MNVAASLKRKFGPLPAWAWLGIFAAVMVVVRHFMGGGSTPADGGAAAPGFADGSAGYGGRFLGAGGGGDLLPSDQTQADAGLSGPGTAVIFDPLGDNYPAADGGNDTYTPPPYTPSAPAVYNPPIQLTGPAALTIAGGLDPAIATAVQARAVAGRGAKQKTPPKPKATTPPRPTSTRGQRAAPAPELVSENGRVRPTVSAPTPARTVQAAAPTPARAVQHAAIGPAPELVSEHGQAAPAPVRSTAAVAVNTGARAVGTTTSAATYQQMGRKLELD